MAKPFKRMDARLARRQAGYRAAKSGASKLPGSQNPHKSASVGMGRRSKNKIKADSRNATS